MKWVLWRFLARAAVCVPLTEIAAAEEGVAVNPKVTTYRYAEAGRSVYVAARVQSLADAGEICLSETVYTAPGVRELLSGHRVSSFEASLRGIEPTRRFIASRRRIGIRVELSAAGRTRTIAP